MGRGSQGSLSNTGGGISAPSSRPEEPEYGLSHGIHFERSTIDNWARYTEGPDSVVAARTALMRQVDEVGEFSEEPPNWMTSVRPGIDGWIFLPGNVVLPLRRLTTEREVELKKGRTWNAINCLAPRRGGARRQTTQKAMTHSRLDDETVARLQGLSPDERVEAIARSAHAIERAQERLGLEREDAETLLAAVWAEGELVSPPPAWANSNGRNAPVLLWSGEAGGQADEIALPLAPRWEEAPPEVLAVASTMLNRRWVEADLLDIKDPAKAVRISLKAAQAATGLQDETAADLAMESLNAGHPTLTPSPRWVLATGYYDLRAATTDQREDGVRWNAIKWHQS